MRNTPVKDFETSTMEDTTPSWLEKGKPLWLCGLDEDGSEKKSEANSDGYIAEPFPEHKIEPFEWQDVLTTLDVCAKKVHGMRHCDDEGYAIRSLNMVVVLQDCEEFSCSSGSYDEEIILEGPNADLSRISHVVQTMTDKLVPCMRLKQDISSF